MSRVIQHGLIHSCSRQYSAEAVEDFRNPEGGIGATNRSEKGMPQRTRDESTCLHPSFQAKTIVSLRSRTLDSKNGRRCQNTSVTSAVSMNGSRNDGCGRWVTGDGTSLL